jgi:ABC-type nitrate/sulfonate/bicarbonate transport system permease component
MMHSRYSQISLATFFPVFTNTFAGVATVDDTLIQTARTFRTSWVRTLLRVILPATLPAIAAGLRTATSLALVVRRGIGNDRRLKRDRILPG